MSYSIASNEMEAYYLPSPYPSSTRMFRVPGLFISGKIVRPSQVKVKGTIIIFFFFFYIFINFYQAVVLTILTLKFWDFYLIEFVKCDYIFVVIYPFIVRKSQNTENKEMSWQN